jgi:hypothetical protein
VRIVQQQRGARGAIHRHAAHAGNIGGRLQRAQRLLHRTPPAIRLPSLRSVDPRRAHGELRAVRVKQDGAHTRSTHINADRNTCHRALK